MKLIDSFLNRITMYRLVLYELIFLLFIAGGLGLTGHLPFAPQYLAWSIVLLVGFSLAMNTLFARVFDAPANPESAYITALILALIITPPSSFADLTFISLAFWAAAWAMASKYILAVRSKHLFNPAAVGVVMTALFLNQAASWWVGTDAMLPFVLLGGFLVVRKIRRFDLVISFLITAGAAIMLSSLTGGLGLVAAVKNAYIMTPTIFLATVMLTEPLTTPPTRTLRIMYGAIVGVLFYPNIAIAGVYMTPGIALLIGNAISYLMSPKAKLILSLQDRIQLAPNVFEFVFAPNRALAFRPGQYLEWTLAHTGPDTRGIRRYFTIVSPPGDPTVRLGVKFYDPASTFKQELFALRRGDTVVASQLAGDFTLPRDKSRKLVFMAGGIGITPFVSMIRHLINTQERRDIVLLYANNRAEDAAYRELLEQAAQLGVRTIHVFSKEPQASGGLARIDEQVIRRFIPDYHERTFYISGPHGMVEALSEALEDLDIAPSRIKTDYFPGFA